jgi:hypothetical protein
MGVKFEFNCPSSAAYETRKKNLTHRSSLPSYFLALVNITVLAGMFNPIANVSVANNTLIRPSPNNISIVSFKIGNKPGNEKGKVFRRTTIGQ